MAAPAPANKRMATKKPRPCSLARHSNLPELRQGLQQPLVVDVDPSTADEHRPTAVGRQALRLGGGQRLAILSERPATAT